MLGDADFRVTGKDHRQPAYLVNRRGLVYCPPVAPGPDLEAGRCRSSVVEHSLGKGEVESSILSGSTISGNIRRGTARIAKWLRYLTTMLAQATKP